jgi:succinoglycan biosynthesis transport protein ExoP
MATQVDIIRSERVALRVVRNLKLADNPQVRAQWQDATEGQGSIEQWLIRLFQRQLDVVPARESSVIRWATRRPTRVCRRPGQRLRAGLHRHRAGTARGPGAPVQRPSSTPGQGSPRSAGKGAGRLSAFQRDNGIIATDERLDVENARLNELSRS